MSQCVKHKDTDTRQIKLIFSIRIIIDVFSACTHLLTALAMSSVSFNSPRSIPRLRDKWDKQTNEEEEIDRCLRSHSIGQKVLRVYAHQMQQGQCPAALVQPLVYVLVAPFLYQSGCWFGGPGPSRLLRLGSSGWGCRRQKVTAVDQSVSQFPFSRR